MAGLCHRRVADRGARRLVLVAAIVTDKLVAVKPRVMSSR
jgi:hypothetical protein